MSKRIKLDRVDVPQPCSKSWESMIGTARERACDACNRTVHDFSAMTTSEAERLLRERSGDRLCIRFARGADGHVITADRPDRVSYRSRSIARMSFAALAAMLGLAEPNAVLVAAPRAARGVVNFDRDQTASNDQQPIRRDGNLSGTVSESFSGGLSDMTIVAINERTGHEFTTKTDANGRYHLALPRGSYLVNVDGLFVYVDFAAEGFKVGPASMLNVTMQMRCLGECVEIRTDARSGVAAVVKAPITAIKKLLGK